MKWTKFYTEFADQVFKYYYDFYPRYTSITNVGFKDSEGRHADYKEEQILREELYRLGFFDIKREMSSEPIAITLEGRDIVDNYESFSAYLLYLNAECEKEELAAAGSEDEKE